MRPYSYQQANQIKLRELLGLGVPSVGPFVGDFVLDFKFDYIPKGHQPFGSGVPQKSPTLFASLGLLPISNFGIFFENKKTR